ncbi:MAG: toll/interleukin-1 receptor domain-containing protein, partial [Candidatus Hodarchaeota archaeon]
MGIIAFISYATKDTTKFQISRIADRLTEYPEIDDVLYWEEDLHDDIIKYMNDNIDKCNIFLLFCSENALASEPIETEWQTAFKLKKKIIPIFIDQSHIPPLISTKLGIQFDESKIDRTIKNIYKLISKKLDYSKIFQEKKEKETIVLLKEIIMFRGAQIPRFEAEVLTELENFMKIQFT